MRTRASERHRRRRGAFAGAYLAVMTLVATLGVHELRAHGTEARRVVALTWPKDRITRVLDVNRSELGLNGSKVPATLKTVGGRSCLFGDLFAFDIDDRYAFDVDEPVDVTVMYAPDLTQPFTVAWDQNAGNGYGISGLVTPEPGAELRQVTIRLDRARFAGQGILRTDLAVGARGGIALCDLVVVRSGSTPPAAPAGTLRIEVRDQQTDRAVPARLGLYDATGRTPLPSDRSLPLHRYADDTRLLWTAPRLVWPNPNRQVFYVDGRYEAEVPAGTYQLVASKGPEYRVYQGTIDVIAGETTGATVTLERYIDQPSRGWYSGDDHLHLMRDETADPAVWGYVTAEDVHVGNLLEMGNIVTTHYRQPAWGSAGRFLRDGHMIASGQEDPRTTQRGHTIHHNLQRPIHLPADRYFSYHEVFEESHRQGGVSGYAHYGRSFNGRRGLVLDVPFDLVDFIEILQGGRLITDNWYPFLNLGFKLNPSAGSDFPYFGPSLPGVERYYVELDGPFDPDAWYAAFKAGRVFVTNGPLLDFTINGQGMGSEVRVSRGARLDVSALAQLNPDLDRLGRIELVAHGEVIATVSADGGDRAELDEVLTADQSMWLAVRAFGEQEVPARGPLRLYAALAHSAPIYVIVDDQPFWKTEEVPALVAEQRQMLADLISAPVDPVGDLEAWETLSTLALQWNRQRNLLRPRVEAADAKYQEILEQATDTTSAGAGQPRTDQRARPVGPSGGYNQRDLEVARPFGERRRDEVARALNGSVDIHMHTHPDVAERPVDAFDAARIAKSYGLRAIVLKNHHEPTAAQAYLVRQAVPGIEIFGGITMDLTNGGVNPAAVEHMAGVKGGFGRIVWMPTYDAEAVVRASRQNNRPFARVSRDGELLPETKAVLTIIAEHGLVLATGHVSPAEGLMLVREARRVGVQHIVITHAMDNDWTVPQMREAAQMGAFIEFAKPLGILTVDQYAEGIRQVGPRFCIVSQAGVSHLPPALVGAFIVALRDRGFSERELDVMMKENPARLLGLRYP